MSHLEDLLAEYYDWKGYLVKRNIKVGKLKHGGYAGELDIVAYHPHTGDLLHLEPSVAAESWEVRKKRYKKKFDAGREHILSHVFTWLVPTTPIRQVAVFIGASPDKRKLAGGEVRTIDECVAEIREAIRERGVASKSAIPEQYPLLRTIQLVECGYYRVI